MTAELPPRITLSFADDAGREKSVEATAIRVWNRGDLDDGAADGDADFARIGAENKYTPAQVKEYGALLNAVKIWIDARRQEGKAAAEEVQADARRDRLRD